MWLDEQNDRRFVLLSQSPKAETLDITLPTDLGSLFESCLLIFLRWITGGGFGESPVNSR